MARGESNHDGWIDKTIFQIDWPADTGAFIKPGHAHAAGQLDLIIEGGWVIDGLGGPRVRAGVGVADGRIAALGDLSGYIADRRLDATGRIVAPGFIDDGHDDLMFVEKPDLAWKTSQGITSVVVGNCGISGAPAPLPNHAAALALLGESPLYRHGCVLRHVAAQRPMINVAALVGHANLRLAAMRDPSAQPADEQRMERMLDASLAAGAVGFSTGLAYQPGGMARRPSWRTGPRGGRARRATPATSATRVTRSRNRWTRCCPSAARAAAPRCCRITSA